MAIYRVVSLMINRSSLIRLILVDPISMPLARLTASTRRDTRSPVLVVLTALGMASSDQTVSSISRRVNGNSIPAVTVYILLTDTSRYANMDLALISTLMPSLEAGISRVLVSYDIGCQWNVNLQDRLKIGRAHV